MTFTVLSVHDARLLGWGLGWCPVELGYGYLRPRSEEEYVRLLSSAAWSTAGAEGLQRYTPISTSSSLCEVETGSLHAYPGFSPALVAIFWQACRPAPLAQAFNDLFRRTVKAAPTSARASALTSCCASGFSPTRGPRQFRGLGVNLFSAPRRLGLPLDPGRGRLALETAAGP
jgi:hypothetical protein